MRAQSHAIVEYPIFSILACAGLASAFVIPLVFAAHQDPQEPRPTDDREKLLFVDQHRSAPVALHQRLFAALDRGDTVEVATICRSAAAMEKGARLCLVLQAPETAAEALRGQESIDRLIEMWPRAQSAEEGRVPEERSTRILRSEVLQASPACAIVVLDVERPAPRQTEDKIPKPDRFLITSVVVKDDSASARRDDAPVASSDRAADGDQAPAPFEPYRIAHLHLSRAQ